MYSGSRPQQRRNCLPQTASSSAFDHVDWLGGLAPPTNTMGAMAPQTDGMLGVAPAANGIGGQAPPGGAMPTIPFAASAKPSMGGPHPMGGLVLAASGMGGIVPPRHGVVGMVPQRYGVGGMVPQRYGMLGMAPPTNMMSDGQNLWLSQPSGITIFKEL